MPQWISSCGICQPQLEIHIYQWSDEILYWTAFDRACHFLAFYSAEIWIHICNMPGEFSWCNIWRLNQRERNLKNET